MSYDIIKFIDYFILNTSFWVHGIEDLLSVS